MLLEATPTTMPRQPVAVAAAALRHRRPIEMPVLPTSHPLVLALREVVAVPAVMVELVLRQSRVSSTTFRSCDSIHV